MVSSNEYDETLQIKFNSNTQQHNNVDIGNDANGCDLPYCSV